MARTALTVFYLSGLSISLYLYRHMEMAVDIGNTRSKVAVFKGDQMLLVRTFRKLSAADILKITKANAPVSSVILCESGKVSASLKRMLRKNFFLFEFGNKALIPFRNMYKTPSTLGKDRIALVSGACKMFPGKEILVIDAGTCVTFDFISRSKEYLGGSISPGIQMRFKALHNYTERLPLISSPEKTKIRGTSTRESILSGVVNGTLAEVDGLISQYKKLYPGTKVLLTGGDSSFLAANLKSSTFVVPHLLMNGLIFLLKLNIIHENKK